MSEKKVPFFARFLEKQGLPEVKTDVKAGGRYVTLKYPSDNDESYVTLKYPSDNDEGGYEIRG